MSAAVFAFCGFSTIFSNNNDKEDFASRAVTDATMFWDFFRPKIITGTAAEPPNEARLLNPWPRILALAACAGGGFMYAAALPPLNLSFVAFFALLPVMIYVSIERRWYMRALAGWLWGWCWAICAYFWLREIE